MSSIGHGTVESWLNITDNLGWVPDHSWPKGCRTHSNHESSDVQRIGLVTMEEGELGLWIKFWDGKTIVYHFEDSDDAIKWYKKMQRVHSKGHTVMTQLINQDYYEV